jgi:hypothetical protein
MSPIIWTVDEYKTTTGERQGVSPPIQPRRIINDHFQNTQHAVPDRGARCPQKVATFNEKPNSFLYDVDTFSADRSANSFTRSRDSAIP